MYFLYLSILSFLAKYAFAGFPPQPEGTTTKQVNEKPGVSISWKQTSICETKAKGYAGYVNLPVSELSGLEAAAPYNISMLFWFFEARINPTNAPTTIYLAGGPGQPSLVGATQSGGPCTILPDANSTQDNPWAWNTEVNMLYIDQPVGTGYSFDTLINSTIDLLYVQDSITSTAVTPFDDWDELPAENTTFLYGTFPSQSLDKTANNTANAARTLWRFSQVWFTEFPEYTTENKDISLWGNSYGGYYVPVSAEYFLHQNERIRTGDINGNILDVTSVGWTNGCTDQLYQAEWYPDMAYNNTYDLQVIPEDVYLDAKNNFIAEGGCRDLIQQCRQLGDLNDPDNVGMDDDVNQLCVETQLYCAQYVLGAYDALSNRSDFDMAHIKPEPFPTSYLDGFFDREWVQRDLGVPVNYTSSSLAVNSAFFYLTGDAFRVAGMKSIEYLLENGVKVAMVYGDRDYRCPWNGGEQLSLQANWTDATEFRSAGYQYIQTGECQSGGVVRQHGNLCFTRVFQSGHDVAAYKPHLAFEVFNRAMMGKDIASGRVSVSDNYTTFGPESSWHIRESLPEAPAVNCNLYSVLTSCTKEQYNALLNGTAVVEKFTIISPLGLLGDVP